MGLRRRIDILPLSRVGDASPSEDESHEVERPLLSLGVQGGAEQAAADDFGVSGGLPLHDTRG
jgi:hypothetical protein